MNKEDRDYFVTIGLMSTIIFLVMVLVLFSGCGPRGHTGKAGKDGTQGQQGIQGEQGIQGSSGNDGEDGSPGQNSLVKLTRSSSIDSLICESEAGVIIESGLDIDSSSVLDPAEVQAIAVVCDGNEGPIGLTGPQGPTSPMSVASIVDPCGDDSGIYDEVILRLANGQLLASFSDNANGKNTRFSLLTPGSYVTTDGSNCNFSVDNDLNVSW